MIFMRLDGETVRQGFRDKRPDCKNKIKYNNISTNDICDSLVFDDKASQCLISLMAY